MLALDGAEATVGQQSKPAHLVDGLLVVLDILPVAHQGDEVVHDEALGVHVGVKAGTALGAEVDVAIGAGQGAGNVAGVVALVLLGLERVAFKHEQGVAVEGGQLCRFPGQQVMVDVPAPLGHDLHFLVGQLLAVDDGDHRVVALVAAAPYVDGGDIAVSHCCGLGHAPHLEASGGVVEQPYALQVLAVAAAGDIALELGRRAAVAQLVETLEPEGAAPRVVEGFDSIARKLGHEGVVRGIHLALVVIPVDLLERAAVLVPQLALIVVHAAPQLPGIGHGQLVDFDLVPGYKYGLLVALAAAGPQPLVVKEVAHAVGGRLEDDDGVAAQHHRPFYSAHHVDGVVPGAVFPEGHFAQVGHGQVETAHCILAAGRACDDDAAARRQLLHASHALERLELQPFHARVEHLGRVVPQQLRVDAPYVARRASLVAAYEAIPVAVHHNLHPGHVEYGQGRRAPLPCLEHDQAHAVTREPLLLHGSGHSPLRAVGHKGHDAVGDLVLNGGAAGTPELKVVFYALAILLQGRQRRVAWHRLK